MDASDMEDQDGIRSIVIGYDGSPGSRQALDWASETAKDLGGKLTIVHAVNLAMIPGFSMFDGNEYENTVDDAAKSVLDDGRALAGRHLDDSVITTLSDMGTPAGALVELSGSADLVVTGTRARGRLAGGLLGSTSYSVAAHAKCPVVVVRALTDDEAGVVPRPDTDHAVVVGVDDSEPASRAVTAAARVAATWGAPLRIAYVAHAPSMESWAYVETSKAGSEATHRVRQHADTTLAAASDRATSAHPDLTVSTEVLYGEPGPVLAELAGNAGLVVVGSRGRGGFAGMLLGSTSHRLIHDATCPVMVVR
jgi:nucleotide-binding universal stress UspA family protein